MTAALLKGGPVAAGIRETVAADVAAFKDEFGYTPELAIVVVGADAPSMYLMKRIDAGQLAHLKPIRGMQVGKRLYYSVVAVTHDEKQTTLGRRLLGKRLANVVIEQMWQSME